MIIFAKMRAEDISRAANAEGSKVNAQFRSYGNSVAHVGVESLTTELTCNVYFRPY